MSHHDPNNPFDSKNNPFSDWNDDNDDDSEKKVNNGDKNSSRLGRMQLAAERAAERARKAAGGAAGAAAGIVRRSRSGSRSGGDNEEDETGSQVSTGSRMSVLSNLSTLSQSARSAVEDFSAEAKRVFNKTKQRALENGATAKQATKQAIEEARKVATKVATNAYQHSRSAATGAYSTATGASSRAKEKAGVVAKWARDVTRPQQKLAIEAVGQVLCSIIADFQKVPDGRLFGHECSRVHALATESKEARARLLDIVGKEAVTIAEGRIRFVDRMNFPWEHDITPAVESLAAAFVEEWQQSSTVVGAKVKTAAGVITAKDVQRIYDSNSYLGSALVDLAVQVITVVDPHTFGSSSEHRLGKGSR